MFVLFLKAIWIGATLSVPGVSGGSMALILGEYENLVRSVNLLISQSSKKKSAVIYLLVFCCGGIAGLVAISGVILSLLEKYPTQTIFFFAGAVAGGIPLIWRESKKGGIRWVYLLYILLGILAVCFLSILPEGLFQIGEGGFLRIILQFLGGIIGSIALILPGISISHMLYVMGLYNGIMQAISDFNVVSLIPFALGLTLGILLFTRLTDYLLKRFRAPSYLLIFGFVLGSVGELLLSGLGLKFSLDCILFFIAGFCVIYLVSKQKRTDA